MPGLDLYHLLIFWCFGFCIRACLISVFMTTVHSGGLSSLSMSSKLVVYFWNVTARIDLSEFFQEASNKLTALSTFDKWASDPSTFGWFCFKPLCKTSFPHSFHYFPISGSLFCNFFQDSCNMNRIFPKSSACDNNWFFITFIGSSWQKSAQNNGISMTNNLWR